MPTGGIYICCKKWSRSWYRPQMPPERDIDLHVPFGALVAVDLLAAGAASACVGKSQPLMVLESMSVKPSLESDGSLLGR
jgi:hypothetical protein